MKKQAANREGRQHSEHHHEHGCGCMKAWSQGGIFAAPYGRADSRTGCHPAGDHHVNEGIREGTITPPEVCPSLGDGGRPEIVLSRGKAWLTPDTPDTGELATW